ncbi:MAG TPA: hypothetical protein DCS43_16610 [Verrucomicrobia bacterium]|nr:hypothetical protein [Verrucomicrobiota bacterium]
MAHQSSGGKIPEIKKNKAVERFGSRFDLIKQTELNAVIGFPMIYFHPFLRLRVFVTSCEK